MANVRPGRAEDANEVETGMLKKALVFRGKDGLHEKGRQIFIAHGAALFSGAVEEIGDEFRLDFRTAQIRATGKRADGANDLAAELHGNGVGPAEKG